MEFRPISIIGSQATKPINNSTYTFWPHMDTVSHIKTEPGGGFNVRRSFYFVLIRSFGAQSGVATATDLTQKIKHLFHLAVFSVLTCSLNRKVHKIQNEV